MGHYRISCVVREHGLIASVGIGGRIFSVIEVVNWIIKMEHTFYTAEGGHLATVYARHHPFTGRWFLTTQPDGILEDNLGFLSECT